MRNLSKRRLPDGIAFQVVNLGECKGTLQKYVRHTLGGGKELLGNHFPSLFAFLRESFAPPPEEGVWRTYF